MLHREFLQSPKTPRQVTRCLFEPSSRADDVMLPLACYRCLSSKRKDSEPGTKSLLGNAEMMAHHPTDPVEMRRINFQTPGMKRAPTQRHTLCICMIKCTSEGLILFGNEIFMQLILSLVRLCRQDKVPLPHRLLPSQPAQTWRLPQIKMAAAQVVQSVI